MSGYKDLLKTPGVARIIAAQLTARFPFGMLSIAFLMHIEHVEGSYGSAGLVLASASIGQAIAGPLTSRWMGLWGMRRVIALTMIVCFTSVSSVALFILPLPFYMALAFLGGLSTPPVQPAVRTIYPKMVNSKQLTPLFSLDASAQEIIWVLGPVVTVFVAGQYSTQAGILTAMVIMLLGGTWFISSPEVGQVRIPRSRRKMGAVLSRPSVVVATVVGFLLISSAAAVEAGIVSHFGEGDLLGGVVLAIFAVGSLVGGLALGHTPISPWSLTRRLLIVAAGLALTVVWLNVWWLSIMLFIAGIGIAPALAVLFAMVSSTVKFSETAEAYGWVGTGQLIGAATGSAIAGFLIDAVGSSGAFAVATIFGLIACGAAAIGSRWSPDLRGRDASPLPDTEQVPIQGH
ncbi:MFS transporter [Lysinibacter sp. HNR]|uniref:MFS transporter n=1 Tax=Lysinibacter sp. HNR TaxID=3031408 RepID=UPI002435EE71|nr:MFS transporter [Lysinibacter sp. HNR]WGD37960.1 MFS transporter [Lysinibacter sp. HNR]